MSYYKEIETYAAGEQSCPSCKTPLPAHQTWPGARVRYCLGATCQVAVTKGKSGRYVGPLQFHCEADDCCNFVREGWYTSQSKFLFCSADCFLRHKNRDKPLCACGCGGRVLHRVDPEYKLSFVNQLHRAAYLKERNIHTDCGKFAGLARQYLEGFAALHYTPSSQQGVGGSIRTFFRYLNEAGVESLGQVRPKTITAFLVWSSANGIKSTRAGISNLKVFFDWAIVEAELIEANPVVTKYHGEKKKPRNPRPLTQKEKTLAMGLLEARGDARLLLAASIAEDAGLRISEICQLRVEDIDLEGQRCFVRLPNKAKKERYANFSDRTVEALKAWADLRDPTCGHSSLLYNAYKRPMSPKTLRNTFGRALCNTFQGKLQREEGFDRWSTHRLRHSMARNLHDGGADVPVIMANGGWNDADSMMSYLAVDQEQVRREYHTSMEAIRNEKADPVMAPEAVPLSEFLRRRTAAAETGSKLKKERCV